MKSALLAGMFAASIVFSATTQAAGTFDTDKLYLGGGLSSNHLSGWDDALGFQLFAGIPLNLNTGSVKSAVEVGYMDSGEFEQSYSYFCGLPTLCRGTYGDNVTGIWANYVASIPLAKSVQGIGRIGLDFGDDDGLMVGAGLGFNVSPQLDLRTEYVARDHVKSLQLNLAYHIK